jgi:hypothetical protein
MAPAPLEGDTHHRPGMALHTWDVLERQPNQMAQCLGSALH